MKRAPPRRATEALDPIERHLSCGDWRNASLALLPELDARAADGDRAAGLAARLLRIQDATPAAPDALATALDRLVALVEHQEAQIRALQAMLEENL